MYKGQITIPRIKADELRAYGFGSISAGILRILEERQLGIAIPKSDSSNKNPDPYGRKAKEAEEERIRAEAKLAEEEWQAARDKEVADMADWDAMPLSERQCIRKARLWSIQMINPAHGFNAQECLILNDRSIVPTKEHARYVKEHYPNLKDEFGVKKIETKE
jgi:hypothetical protein